MPVGFGVLTALAVSTSFVSGQAIPEDLVVERTEFATWLTEAARSPYRAVVQHPIGPGLSIGPATADVPLAGVDARIEQRGAALTLTTGGSPRPMVRDRLVPLGDWQLLAAGLAGQATLTVFSRAAKPHQPPDYYRYAAIWRRVATLVPVSKASTRRLLAADGTEVEATEAGTVSVSVGGRAVALTVFRIPAPGGEESELEIYFRDGTNNRGSYPAGRFVTLHPLPDGRWQLDFNRSRNPFCAYSTVYACPAPWRGNVIPLAVEAGERYRGGGLTPPLE